LLRTRITRTVGLPSLRVTHAEVEITAELVRDLPRDQHARGWDDQLWRLGDDLAVRLP
jgi:hypothetical protein